MSYEQKCNKCIDQMPLENFPVAMAYVPWQTWGNLYDLDKAFEVGTIFKDLHKPFLCYKS